MFVALGAGYPTVAVLHFVAHALMKAPLFLIVGLAGDKAASYQLKALGKTALPNSLKFATLGATLALAGLFPLGAGWTKEAIVTAAGHYTPWAAVATALAGGLSAIYAARLLFSLFPRFYGVANPETAADQQNERFQQAAIYALVLATLAASLMWVPGIPQQVAGWFDSGVPPFKAWELALSMMLVATGIVLGLWLANKNRHASGESTLSIFISTWMGLPGLARLLVVNPVLRVAEGLAYIDDRAVDAGVTATARFANWTGVMGDRIGEWLFDEMPEGLARLSGRAGRQLRQLQSGMLHHYYFVIAAGFVAIIITFAVGTLMGDML